MNLGEPNPNTVAAINQIASLSRDVGEKIWKIPGKAINARILDEPLGEIGKLTAKACISLWTDKESISLGDLFKYDIFAFDKFVAALALLRKEESELANKWKHGMNLGGQDAQDFK